MNRTEPTRLPELMSHDRAALDALLESTVVGHIAFVAQDGSPAVLPTAVVRWGERLVVHGSTGSRWMRLVAGSPAVVSVTAVDGIIVARSAFESSLAYRSAVFFGSFDEVTGDDQLVALDLLTDRLVPGRVAEVRRPTRKELAATVVLAMPISQWSLRVSTGWADDPAEDVAGSAWAGQVVFGDRPATVRAAPDLRAGIVVPPSVSELNATH
ncbi:MAG: pyridoxamine 5'-phosphate oxidase family protein [Actinomycetota bacterium]|nr:pyridoxamine 5'-phosphate oxidase family protein [Actinomycetota bacterium]